MNNIYPKRLAYLTNKSEDITKDYKLLLLTAAGKHKQLKSQPPRDNKKSRFYFL